jgi:glycosyltransferase involved in cell wall biosynthesis
MKKIPGPPMEQSETGVKKTILYLRTDLSATELIAGGSVSHTVGVLNGFIKLGYEVVCASSTMQSVLKTVPLKQLVLLENPRWLQVARWKLNCFFSNFFFTMRMLPLFKKYQFSFIYQRYSLLNCIGVLLSKIKNVPLILEYNGSEAWVDKHWVRSKWFKFTWLIALIERINIRYASMIVVVSQVLKDELIGRGVSSQKILVNPNGVDADLYDPAKLVHERATVRKQLGIEDKFVFGFVGTFSYWHGIDVIEQMIIELCKKTRHAHFLLIGDGPLRATLIHNIQRSGLNYAVTFAGMLAQQEARAYLAACDAFLCPTQPNPDGSRFFGSPTKMFEYMSMGKPIIASDLEQLGELLYPAVRGDSDVTGVGFLIAPEDVKGFVQAAFKLIAMDETIYTVIGKNARLKVEEKYTWLKHVQKIGEFIHEL